MDSSLLRRVHVPYGSRYESVQFATGFDNLVGGVGGDRVSKLALKLAEGYIWRRLY